MFREFSAHRPLEDAGPEPVAIPDNALPNSRPQRDRVPVARVRPASANAGGRQNDRTRTAKNGRSCLGLELPARELRLASIGAISLALVRQPTMPATTDCIAAL
jgi:hypothetical protein